MADGKSRLYLAGIRTVDPTDEQAYWRAWELLFAEDTHDNRDEPVSARANGQKKDENED